jgi:selenocysteine-specific elongation factor
VRVRGVQSGGRAIEHAVAGQRTALNLAGVDLADVERGMVLATPGRFQPTRRMDARVTLLPSARRLKNHAKVHFHQGTAETVAEVVLLDRAELPPGQSAFAQLRLDDAVLVLPGDRFILRQFSPVLTIGGGAVLDALAQRHRQRDSHVVPYLATVERGNREEILAAMAAAAPHGLELSGIVARTGWLVAEVQETAARLAEAGTLRVLTQQPLVVASAASFAECVGRMRAEIEAFHRANPLVEGISKEDLRARAAREARPELFRAALDELVAGGQIVVGGDIVKRAGREIALQPEEARAKEQIEREFARAGLAVPSLEEVLSKLPVETKRAQKLLQLLVREHVLVKVSEDLVFHRSAVARLREMLADYKKRNGERLPIAAFKELTGITRKYAIPLLEYLDRERITRRIGDERVIL